MLYIQELYRVELFRPVRETVHDDGGRERERERERERVRNGLKGREGPEVVRAQPKRVAEIDLAGWGAGVGWRGVDEW